MPKIPIRYTATRVSRRMVKTTCRLLLGRCGMLLGVRDNQAVAARGNPNHPVNRGKLCPRVSPSTTFFQHRPRETAAPAQERRSHASLLG